MNTLVFDVDIEEIKQLEINELSERVTTTCHFCEKLINLPINAYNVYKKIGNREFHCAFCLRNKHHHKSNNNILPISFKGLIGFYYHELYYSVERKMYLSEIISCIEKHQTIGLQNPVFNYDYDNFLWFIDFNQIGNTKHKLPIEEVYHTITNMINAFNPSKHLKHLKVDIVNLKQKFIRSIELFYTKRKKQCETHILCPTLSNVIFNYTYDEIEETKIIYPYYFYETLLNVTPLTQVKNMCFDLTQKKENNMNQKNLTVTVNQKTTKGVKGWEGTISLPGLKSTKLSRADGTTLFSTRGALNTVARAVAARIGYELQYQEPVVKVAASKANKATKKEADTTSK